LGDSEVGLGNREMFFGEKNGSHPTRIFGNKQFLTVDDLVKRQNLKLPPPHMAESIRFSELYAVVKGSTAAFLRVHQP
jgi:hypothetical protein